jgi:hypothetical protein
VENAAPWSLFGDIDGDFYGVVLKPGQYNITAEPFSEINAGGLPGYKMTMQFEIPEPSSQPSSTPSREPSLTPSRIPSGAPSFLPSANPSNADSDSPSSQPTKTFSSGPYVAPSFMPSEARPGYTTT